MHNFLRYNVFVVRYVCNVCIYSMCICMDAHINTYTIALYRIFSYVLLFHHVLCPRPRCEVYWDDVSNKWTKKMERIVDMGIWSFTFRHNRHWQKRATVRIFLTFHVACIKVASVRFPSQGLQMHNLQFCFSHEI